LLDSDDDVVVGVTGAPGSGKTSVAREFALLGAEVVALDALGHELLVEPEVREAVRDAFSTGVFQILDGEVSRSKLAAVVFEDAEELAKLNRILHPRMVERIRARIESWRAEGREPDRVPDTGRRMLAIEGALVIEMGVADLCDRVVLVTAPREERLARLRRTRGWDESELARRQRFQLDEEARRARADAVVVNASTLEGLGLQVKALWEEWT
jgi:dephospho-CoA kinase